MYLQISLWPSHVFIKILTKVFTVYPEIYRNASHHSTGLRQRNRVDSLAILTALLPRHKINYCISKMKEKYYLRQLMIFALI